MRFTPKPSNNVSCPSAIVNNTWLKEVNHQKYLGIIFDKKLCWDIQINDICKRIPYYLHACILLNHKGTKCVAVTSHLSMSNPITIPHIGAMT